ncbi:MAG: DUF11 domain-containing protein [Planctomycetota bacterium]|nr:MAG: DUF11 domain-containing protein [Planctomycetota bacterium]
MTRRLRRAADRPPAEPAERALRWIRIIAMATGALILASCRSLSTPAIVAGTSLTALPADAGTTAEAEVPAPQVAMAKPHRDALSWDAANAASRRDADVRQAGLEAPCPPLPRLGRRCRVATCPPQDCGPACQPQVCLPCERPFPEVGPYLVCDGGDACAPAQPTGADGLRNLEAGDTVARYRPADDGPDADEVRLVASNCACVFAPRFGAVRAVLRPFEDAAPQGPGGMTLDMVAGLEVERQPVWGSTQNLAPGSARKALPGIAVQERLGPLAMDQKALPGAENGAQGPEMRVGGDGPQLERQAQRPLLTIGFEVPLAWTCIKAANVLLDGRSAETVAVDRGTATLRFEEPGRAELTLCKQAGSDTARPGEELDFTIVMLNSGDRPLTGIVLADALPTRLTLVPDSAAANVAADFSTATGDDGATVLTWKLRDTLRPGESRFVRFRTIVK